MEDPVIHLVLAVRPGTQQPYCVEGDGGDEIGRHHGTASEAEAAIHRYCREQHFTATVRVYTPDDRLWREDEVDAEGNVAATLAAWRTAALGWRGADERVSLESTERRYLR